MRVKFFSKDNKLRRIFRMLLLIGRRIGISSAVRW